MSRLSDRLARIRKSSGPIGFGFGAAAADARRMLVVPVIDAAPPSDSASLMRERADAVILQHNPDDGIRALSAVQEAFPDLPVGLRLAGPDFDEKLLVEGCDFVVCTVDAPLGLLSQEASGVYIELDAGVEASRLRALSDIGVEGVVLAAESVALRSLSAAVECRRIRTMTGSHLLVKVLEPVTPAIVSGLWKAGVDALVTDAGGSVDLFVSVRDSIDQAKLETRRAESGFSAGIGQQMRRTADVSEEEPVEDDDFDDE